MNLLLNIAALLGHPGTGFAWVLAVAFLLSIPALYGQTDSGADLNRARQLMQKEKHGQALTEEESAYLQRAKALRRTADTGTNGDNERVGASLVPGIDIPLDRCPIEKITATTEDEQEIRAFYRKPPGEGPFPAVICIHGSVHSSKDMDLKKSLISNPTYTRLLASGYVTVAGDFRSYPRSLKSRGPVLDCLATSGAVKKMPFVDPQSVAVFGGSGGGSIALELAASTNLAAIVCGEPATLLFMGMLDSFGERDNVLAEPHRFYTSECKERTQRKISNITCPILILDGDRHALNTLNREILLPELKAANVEIEYKIYPGNQHGFYWGKNKTTLDTLETMMTDVKAFLLPRLKTAPKPLQSVASNEQDK